MIHLLHQTDVSRLDVLSGQSFSECRIKALSRVYGMDYSFLRFYADDENEIFFSFEKDFATLYLKNADKIREVSEFCFLTAGEVLSEMPLVLPGFSVTKGNIYEKDDVPPKALSDVTNDLQEGYKLLSMVFPDFINEKTYHKWYADLFRRVCHGVSKIYTVPGKCSVTVYCAENGMLTISQLGVAPEFRGKGLARALLSHIAADNKSYDRMILQSGDKISDGFYKHLGFWPTGKWYLYKRI